jgi:cytochrome c
MRTFAAAFAVLCTTVVLAETPAKATKGPAPKAAPVVATPTPDAKPAATASPAAPATALDGAKLFMDKTCLSCHGKDAKTPILPEYPRLAGQGAVYAERQMKDIKSGARNNGNTAAMKGIMVLVNDDEIHALAQYISTLK